MILRVNSNCLVSELKAKISEVWNVPVGIIKLIHSGQILVDAKSLGNYKIASDGAVILCMGVQPSQIVTGPKVSGDIPATDSTASTSAIESSTPTSGLPPELPLPGGVAAHSESRSVGDEEQQKLMASMAAALARAALLQKLNAGVSLIRTGTGLYFKIYTRHFLVV